MTLYNVFIFQTITRNNYIRQTHTFTSIFQHMLLSLKSKIHYENENISNFKIIFTVTTNNVVKNKLLTNPVIVILIYDIRKLTYNNEI